MKKVYCSSRRQCNTNLAISGPTKVQQLLATMCNTDICMCHIMGATAESHAKAMTNSVLLCMWLVNAGRYFSGYNQLLKNKLPVANFLL